MKIWYQLWKICWKNNKIYAILKLNFNKIHEWRENLIISILWCICELILRVGKEKGSLSNEEAVGCITAFVSYTLISYNDVYTTVTKWWFENIPASYRIPLNRFFFLLKLNEFDCSCKNSINYEDSFRMTI